MRSTMVSVCALALALGAPGCDDDSGGGADLATADLGVSDAGAGDLTVAGDLAAPDAAVDAFVFMCTPNAFVMCSGSNAIYCNAAGDATTSFGCTAACMGDAGCGECTGPSCASGMLTACDTTHMKTGGTTTCVTLQPGGNGSVCADPTSCLQCSGATVCGDGSHYGTALDSSYTCTGGVVQTSGAVACAFGCDPATGACRDFVPANQAASHTAGETFTCTGTQDATLPAVAAGAGDTVTFDTVGQTIKKVNGGNMTDYSSASKWGASYTPAGSGTTAVVAHIKSLTVGAGATLVVTGTHALVLLVDGNVSLAGAAGSVTVVSLNGSIAGGSGPGAPSSNGTGGIAAALVGGGGAGHGTAGAAGGNDFVGTTGGVAGAAYGSADVLEAGAAGGANGTNGGGAGGGGLQVSACGTLSIGANVVVNASGGGGRGGGGAGGNPGGGTSGGSGGTLLLEGASVTGNAISGVLAANGGAGGGGGDSTNPGSPGGEWSTTTAPTSAATGGPSATNGAGSGGNGGVAGTAPTAGGNASAAANGGGGGGGAVGRIFLHVSSTATAPTAAMSSPAPKVSTACVTNNGAAPGTCTYP